MSLISETIEAQKLDPANLALSGRHLIEASAGTGKTFNITRLYLRLLLEKQLPVQKILVMTFTKAATEELKGRIDKELRNALNNWHELVLKDEFFAKLAQRLDFELVEKQLKLALLELDDAAVFTIHGFCNRVLLQQAFNSGASLEMQMESDTSELLLNAVRDWFRLINSQSENYQLLKQQNWHTPEQFLARFANLLRSHHAVQFSQLDEIKQQHIEQKQAFFNAFSRLRDLIVEKLVASKKGKEREQRQFELEAVEAWLQAEAVIDAPVEVTAFFNGRRTRDEQLKVLFTEFKLLHPITPKLNLAACHQVVFAGIMQIRAKFEQLKTKQSIMDFDDLIRFLSQKLSADDSSHLISAIRQEYPVALVDEFQDTDPEQYAIFSKLYPQSSEHLALFMIGDPKQAIYGFRGGDIFTYLAARQQADYHWFMDTNWRSTQSMISAYNRLFWGNDLSSPKPADVFGYGIGYDQIGFSQHAHAASVSLDDPNSQVKALNYAFLAEVAEPSGARGATKDDYSTALATWCSNEIVRLLSQAKLAGQALQEQDIAILVRRGAEAELIQQTLLKAGLNSVYLSDRSNIFTSYEARQILYVLLGILELENESLLIRALATELMGWDAAKLARVKTEAFQHEWEEAVNFAVELRLNWKKQGVMTLLLSLIHKFYQPNPDNHERGLTNMIHLAEILQQASSQFKHPQQLVKWFKLQCHEQTALIEAEQRLESDANLIRIVTQHGSKGLEYPIVFVPFASDFKDPIKFGNQTVKHFKYHDPSRGQTQYQLGETEQVKTLATEEGLAESVRLLYVAVTRSSHRCYLGVAPYKDSYKSPLGTCLKLAKDDAWQSELSAVVESSEKASPNSSALILIPPQQSLSVYQVETVEHQLLVPAELSRDIYQPWSLYSFSGLTKHAHVSRAGQLGNQERKDDMLDASSLVSVQAETESAIESSELRFTLKKGAAAGNLLHDVLEHTDFSEPNWDESLPAPLARFGLLEDERQPELITWFEQVLAAPLPCLLNSDMTFCLADLSWQQTLREAEFYFPLEQINFKAVLACLTEHRFGKQASYSPEQMIYLPGQDKLNGMMHGFIDLIFEHDGRFYVADYKSTHLGHDYQDYAFDALKLNNQTHFYDLQYLIYAVALHRYLQTRVPDYQVEQHFGGVYYFYLRGMTDANASVNEEIDIEVSDSNFYGVYYDKLSIELLIRLDKAFNFVADANPLGKASAEPKLNEESSVLGDSDPIQKELF
ncbi:exodeoxyribonuclease V subunit beta [Catenovulum maritimum]|uniref:exodeoxyribonuclease V subunit beta n=1 Tax=Catenovulum maritimum TaxID=1513271 RepID=UPI0006603882|nr:exodeoxyribonuclease V subunit beta [Catenovulum maritimum]